MAGEIEVINKFTRKDQQNGGPVLPVVTAQQVENLRQYILDNAPAGGLTAEETQMLADALPAALQPDGSRQIEGVVILKQYGSSLHFDASKVYAYGAYFAVDTEGDNLTISFYDGQNAVPLMVFGPGYIIVPSETSMTVDTIIVNNINLTSPSGSRFRLTVSDTGELGTTQVIS